MTNWRDKLDSSKEIVERANRDLNPYAVVAMVSGGDDSMTAYHMARYLSLKLDAIIHVITGTGIPDTTRFMHQFGETAPELYLEYDAGDAYEDYVLRKGFFGVGTLAHSYAYHLLKKDGFNKLISTRIRQHKRGRRVLLINGARRDESDNRMFTMEQPIQVEKVGSQNWWVNIINDWSKADCREFLEEMDVQRNPVTKDLCRSGECMCGTMQSQEERREASFFYPAWGKWLDDLESKVAQKFPWKWGENCPAWWKQEKAGQLRLFDFDTQPMCRSCLARSHAAIVDGR